MAAAICCIKVETFEADETEEDREEARREMENRMREYALGAPRNNR